MCGRHDRCGLRTPLPFLLAHDRGAIGGILPDIDLRKPSRTWRLAFSFALPLLVLFELSEKYSIAELWIMWFGASLVIGYAFDLLPVPHIKHRGIFHSTLAGTFFMVLTAFIFDRVFKESSGVARLTGLFVFIGFTNHLVLDEMYAVDYKARKIKRSFGSACRAASSRRFQ